ncbi:hypothetical protein BG015_005823 [Linnemannia schmuckeri]|uniref:Mediator of RNA polymerase II transcription subunit 11 n=1 Tax=Linnemannia schmuckeri TaxID=64567 RepID=A0A9P5S329_9FUNG|nr:hypothetical protein BG015_005823 [Linnemannia schmuckeri]
MENLGLRDTDMASPPSSFHSSQPTSTSTTTAAPASQIPDSQKQHAKAPRTRKTVNDGYIYHPYEDYSQTDRNSQGESNDGDSAVNDSQASATRILELRGLERRIVQLLETAGQAIQILSGEDDPENAGPNLMDASADSTKASDMIKSHAAEKAKQFEVLAAGYATLVNEIQSGLRRQFHYLTKAGIASSQVPFKNVVYGEEKELETWLNAVDVLKESTDGLIEKVEREYLGVSKANGSKDESLQGSSAPPAAAATTAASVSVDA